MKLIFDNAFQDDLKQYTEAVLAKAGVSSRTAEREVIYLAEQGNTVCLKLYGDMLFYKKVMNRHAMREAFGLYLRAAGLSVSEDGTWQESGRAYPEACWVIAYYLVHYRRESDLKDCEMIPEIDRMSLSERMVTAAELAAACLGAVEAPGAINLLGRILQEAAKDEAVRTALLPVWEKRLPDELLAKLGAGAAEGETIPEKTDFSDSDACEKAAIRFFEAAADAGYVYACNNLAAREAERIIEIAAEGKQKELAAVLERYLRWLRIAADRYEPYAANRLGLFYRTGEVRGTKETVHFREYIDSSLAREYFYKATVYPDANSAWAYLNLMKYYHQDYDRDIDLLNEHMAIMKELNPKVYDIAMEM